MEFLNGMACMGCLVVTILMACYAMFVKNWMDNS
jgi:hypothetical protein